MSVTRNQVAEWLMRRIDTPAAAPIQTHYMNALRELNYAAMEEAAAHVRHKRRKRMLSA